MTFELGYQVLLQPAVFAAAIAYALYHILKGFHRVPVTVDGVEVRVTKYQPVGLRKAAVSAGLGVLFLLSTVVVPFGHRGVIWTTSGVDYQERLPGFSFIIPVIESDVLFDVREQRYTTVNEEGKANAFVQSSDLQEITVRASLVYRPYPDEAAELYDQVGPDYVKQVVEPVFFDAIKEAAGQRQALSFAAELGAIADDIEAIVTPQLDARGIEVVSVAVEDAVFDPNFIQAVKDKVIASEEAKEQQNLVAARRAEKDQIILQAEAEEQKRLIEARGESEAIKAVAGALGFSPAEYLQWVKLKAWDGVLPATLIEGDASELLIAP